MEVAATEAIPEPADWVQNLVMALLLPGTADGVARAVKVAEVVTEEAEPEAHLWAFSW